MYSVNQLRLRTTGEGCVDSDVLCGCSPTWYSYYRPILTAYHLTSCSYVDSYRNMAVSQSKSDLKRQMKRFAGMKLRNLNDPYANEPAPLTFIRE